MNSVTEKGDLVTSGTFTSTVSECKTFCVVQLEDEFCSLAWSIEVPEADPSVALNKARMQLLDIRHKTYNSIAYWLKSLHDDGK